MFGKLDWKSLPTHEGAGPYDYGMAPRRSRAVND
jgi:hypothetical protein